jgi:predicted  nucleic acid-binding Zn-ribbon protein
MKIACLSCGHAYDVAEGTNLRGVTCPQCGKPPAAHFPHEKMLRFEAVESPAFARACEHARRGEADQAFAALEEAFRAGYDDVERVRSERDLAPLRNDPRFADLLKRYRPT